MKIGPPGALMKLIESLSLSLCVFHRRGCGRKRKGTPVKVCDRVFVTEDEEDSSEHSYCPGVCLSYIDDSCVDTCVCVCNSCVVYASMIVCVMGGRGGLCVRADIYKCVFVFVCATVFACDWCVTCICVQVGERLMTLCVFFRTCRCVCSRACVSVCIRGCARV